MSQSLVLSFKEGVSLSEENGGDRQLLLPNSSLPIKQLSPGLVTAFQLLGKGTTEEKMEDIIADVDGLSGLVKFHYYLGQFMKLGIIDRTVEADGAPLATLVLMSSPFSILFQIELSEVAIAQKYRLSKFTYCHQHNSQLVVESPLSPAKIFLKDWRGAAIINELAGDITAGDLTKIPGISVETAQMFFQLLLAGKMLCEVSEDGKTEEEEKETFVQWEFHDLLYHVRSRYGRHGSPVGKTQRFFGKLEPLPAIKPKIEGKERIVLFKPDIEKLKESDRFTQVMEERKSIREFGDRPITAEQFGEFLYRSVRVKEVFFKRRMERSYRVYPGGGACHELELYAAVKSCENLESGFYHYCPFDHELERISEITPPVEKLLKIARNASGSGEMPQILILLAARFQRMAWDYESMAYSAILKHVGVLYQTMYLVATAMNLAPSALGTGDSDLFVEAAGTDYYAETSVGEFMLGSCK